MPEGYRDHASQTKLASFEPLEKVTSQIGFELKKPIQNMLDVVSNKIPVWLVRILKRPEKEWHTFERHFVQQAEDTGLLPVTVWWYPSSWAVRRKCYWKYLVENKKFSQLEFLIEERLKRYQGDSD